jgi:hypothetical protein
MGLPRPAETAIWGDLDGFNAAATMGIVALKLVDAAESRDKSAMASGSTDAYAARQLRRPLLSGQPTCRWRSDSDSTRLTHSESPGR